MDDPEFTPDEVALASAEEAIGDGHSHGGEPAGALEADRSAAADVQHNARTVEQVETDSFASEVLDSDRPVLVDFYADWCGPCQQLAPVLDDLAADTPDVKVVKVNIDDSRQLAKTYQVRSVPTLMVFKQGEMVAHHRGAANRKKVEELLAR
jgi:thioredoxin 1